MNSLKDPPYGYACDKACMDSQVIGETTYICCRKAGHDGEHRFVEADILDLRELERRRISSHPENYSSHE